MNTIKSSKIRKIAIEYLKEKYDMNGLKLNEGVQDKKSCTFSISYEDGSVRRKYLGIIIVALDSERVVFATPKSVISNGVREALYEMNNLGIGSYENSYFGWD